ncbi:hypothetical protein A8C56_01845 [Niabella ginsenosidivorans]|uniref:DUF4271 domain-containing protein n=1 Tax=Niabella ginsenosidivorans TaxID=1176587 RepID=A0A1A9HWX5_9BACT|nr:hypothetical protein A8C56_01845 [Niabella ginsenosidivorans]
MFFILVHINGLQAQTNDSSRPKPQAIRTQAKPLQKKTGAKATGQKQPTRPPQQKKPTIQEKAVQRKPAEQKDTTKPAAKKTGQPSKQTQPAAKHNVLQQKPAEQKKDTAKHALKTPVKKTVLKPGQKKDSLAAKKLLKPLITPKPGVSRQDSGTVKKAAHPIRHNPIKRDSLAKADSLRKTALAAAHPSDTARINAAVADSLQKRRQLAVLIRNYQLTWKILSGHPYFAMAAPPVITPYSKKAERPGKELYFYTLAGILLLFAGFKTAFSKYFDDLTTLFFKRTLKQRQLQQQLSQNTLPSFLFNILFTLVAGFYLTLLTQQFTFRKLDHPLWQIFCAAVILVACVYLAKFFLLKLCGWLFNIQNLTDAYIFLIFLVNKIITLFLLPVIVIAALGGTGIKTIIWTLSWLVIAALFLYRFFVTLQMVQKNNRVSLFHFLLYFVAFELLPVFVIYRFILLFLT